MSARANRRGKRLPLGAHHFIVMELIVYPMARPHERRRVPVEPELREMPVADRRTTPDTVALFEFLRREA